MPRLKSLETIILAPVVAFLLLAGIGLFFLISNSVDEFANRSIQENLSSLARAAYEEADGEIDRCNIKAVDCLDGAQKTIHQIVVFERFEDFARQNELGIAVYDVAENRILFEIEIADDGSRDGANFYEESIEFRPWNWRIILVKDSSAFSALIQNVRNIYIGTGVVVLLMAGALSIYLRRAIGLPIGQMVARFGEGNPPDYQGIREFEFLSDSIGQMMLEIAKHRNHLEELVEQRTAELETARSQLTSALENISEGFSLYDADDRLVLCNSRYREIMHPPGTTDYLRPGTPFETVIRTAVQKGSIQGIEGRMEDWITNRLRQHRNPTAPHTHQRANGRWVLINERKTESGGTVGVYTDITEIKQAEIELSDLKDKAEQATQAKSQFLANMSHELRTPMNAIMGFTRLVMRRSGDELAPKQFENLGKILISAENLLSLINDILDLSKIEAGEMTIHPTEFSMEPLIDDGLATVKHLVKNQQVRLLCEVEADLPMLYTDQDKVRQILINLLSNAVKFTEEGSVTARARRCGGEMVAIEVSDTGIGIPSDSLDMIFGQFSQVDDSSTRQHGGTGLGLAITRHLARLLGGDIAVESCVGEGSTFTVTILERYVATDAAEPKEDDAPQAVGEVAGKRGASA